MKSKFTFLALIAFTICTSVCTAQNAFYDAKRIAKYISSDSIREIMPILMNYKKANTVFPWDRYAAKYPDHVGAYKKKFDVNNNKKIASLINDPVSLKNSLVAIQSIDPLLEELRLAVDQLIKANKEFEPIDSIQKFLENKLTKQEVLSENEIAKIVTRANSIQEVDTAQEKIFFSIKSEDTIVKQEAIQSFYSHSVEKRQDQLEYITSIKENIKVLLYEENVRKYFLNEPESKLQQADSKAFYEKLTQEKVNRELSYQEATLTKVSSFRTPSQAEMIDALAIYLAKRVKQEITISFIEKLSTYIRDQPLMATLFPSTLELLNNREAFMRPHFGTSWQIAMSEDFIKLPENLPACLPYRYKHLDKYLQDGVRIGKLVEQHYSFIEAVNQLNEEPLKVDALQHANSLIYIVNHEFYSKEASKNYWVSAEQLQTMNQEQLEWLYILLDLRYGEKLNTMMSKTWLSKSVWNEQYFSAKVLPLRNYLTRVVVQLNHFEKEIENASSSNQKATVGTMLSGYWKFQNDLMNVVIDTQFLNIPAKALKPLELTRGIFSIYSGIESKNYAAVVDQILNLLALLDIDKRSTLQDVLFTPAMLNSLQQKDQYTKASIFNQVNQLNNTYDLLVSSNTLNDLREDYAVLLRKVQDKQRKDILKVNDSPEEAIERIIKVTKANYSGNLDSLFLSKSFLKELEVENRYKDIIEQFQQMNFRYAQVRSLYFKSQQAMIAYDSLKILLAKNDLNKAKYFKINPNKLTHFVGTRIFSLDAAQNHEFFYKMESRQHYQRIRTAMSFLSDVMQSNGSQELSKVIEAYSLPPSSYKMKRLNRFCINFDALVGGYVGLEAIKDNSQQIKTTAVGGLSAPIGLSLSWGRRSMLTSKRNRKLTDNELGFVNRNGNFKLMKGYNTTIMLSVIDIAGPVSYRITNTVEGGLPNDAKWSQLFSPGLIALVGIKGLPLCVGSGLRFTPKLRNLQQGLQRNALRLDIGLYFDLPLVNLYYK